MTFTFLMLSSLCFKQSVNRTFLTPSFSSFFRIPCRVKVKTSFYFCDFKMLVTCYTAKIAARLFTCLLDRSARSILFRISTCGLTSRVSWNTGFRPEKGICLMLRGNQRVLILLLPWQTAWWDYPNNAPSSSKTLWNVYTFCILKYYLFTDLQSGNLL